MLCLDDQVILNGLMDLDPINAVAEVLLTSKQHLFLHLAGLIVTETGRKRLSLISSSVTARRVSSLASVGL